ncbi:hypothetical protein [Pseudomonas sp. RT6P73]
MPMIEIEIDNPDTLKGVRDGVAALDETTNRSWLFEHYAFVSGWMAGLHVAGVISAETAGQLHRELEAAYAARQAALPDE